MAESMPWDRQGLTQEVQRQREELALIHGQRQRLEQRLDAIRKGLIDLGKTGQVTYHSEDSNAALTIDALLETLGLPVVRDFMVRVAVEIEIPARAPNASEACDWINKDGSYYEVKGPNSVFPYPVQKVRALNAKEVKK